MSSDSKIIILAVMTPLIGVFCFIKGYNACAEANSQPEITMPVIKARKKSNNMQENDRDAKILANIDIYDGTEKGQQKING